MGAFENSCSEMSREELVRTLGRALDDKSALMLALRQTLALAEKWAEGFGPSHPVHDTIAEARATLERGGASKTSVPSR